MELPHSPNAPIEIETALLLAEFKAHHISFRIRALAHISPVTQERLAVTLGHAQSWR